MTDENRTPNPPRLLQLSPTMATLFTEAETEYRQALDEAAAWERLQPRLAATDVRVQPRRTRPWLQLTTAVAAGFLLGWFGWRTLQSTKSATIAAKSDVEVPTQLQAADTSLLLAAGKSTLPDGTVVELADGAQGTYRGGKLRSTLEFDRGRLDIAVTRQTAGRPFVVKAAAFEFVVLGTRFSVQVHGPRIALDVTEGRVAVHDAMRQLKVVEVGGHWTNLDDAASTEAPIPSAVRPATPEPSAKAASPSADGAAPSDPASCRDLVRTGKPRQAEQCYVVVASGSGLSAEMALYEVARLRRDVLGNQAGALAALDEYESRFASGTLTPEVRMARVDLLARLGQAEAALAASSQLLGSADGEARSVELRLLRGNLLRDKKHDCVAASAEFQQIEADPGARGDQAEYAHAECLEQLGRSAEAARLYRHYLERPKPQQAERARERLKGLLP